MRPERDPYRDHQYVPDAFWLVVAAVLFAACGLVWLIGQVAAILFGAHEHLPVRLVDMLGVLLRLPGTWDDPAQAWPPSSQPLLPGPVGMYAAAVLTFWLPALLYGLLVRLVSPRARRQRKQRGAKWASWWQLRRLLVVGPRRGRIILGRRDRLRDRLLGRLYLAVEQCHSVLAFGPPGSFKTHGLVIPAILEWQGNLVTTSIKPDVLRATCAHRANLGAVRVYDPLGLSGVPGARWTPLAYCHTYGDARRVGRMLADAADIHGHKADDANYWQLLGAKLLSVLLFAAAGTGRSMADVARWVDVQDVDDVATALMEIGNQQALDAWAACTSRPDNTMGSVYGTAETSWTSTATRSSPRAPRAATSTWTSCRPGPTTPCTCTPPPPSRSGSGPSSSSWSAWSSSRPRSSPPPNPTGCWIRGCSSAWTRRATARPSRSCPSWPPPAAARAFSC
jgi:hypothetical protein